MSNTKYDLKRSEIISCAEKLFIVKGYETTSVNEILKEVGIAKGTFYHYFKSKEAVMDAVIMKFVHEDLEYVQMIYENSELSATQKLFAVFLNNNRSDEKDAVVKQLYEANNAAMKQRALQRTIELIAPIYAKIVEEGNSSGQFSSSNPLEDVQFLIAGIQSMFDLSNIKDSTLEINYEAIVNLIFNVLKINESIVSREEILGGRNELL